MTRHPRHAVVAALLLSGCAYFNGLYNANRLAGDAQKAQRDGRTGEARSLWQQAAIKAESVVVRYPKSAHHDDALLLLGRALSEIGECERALRPLRTAVTASPDAELTTKARLLLGRCLLAARRPDSATQVLEPLTAGAGPTARDALLWRGRAYLALGRHERAIADLSRADSTAAAFDLSLAHIALDSVDRAVAVLDQRVSAAYDESRWMQVLDSLGRRAPNAAARLADRLVARPDLTAGQRARLLVADARRLQARGLTDRATQRYDEARAAAPDSAVSRAARAEVALLDLRRTTDPARLDTLARAMEAATQAGVPLSWPAPRYAQLLRATVAALNGPSQPYDDLRLFRLAELMRDSVGAAPLANVLFHEVYTRHADSPIAPKALLAQAQLNGTVGDTIRAWLIERYPDSPYALVLRGESGERFVALEDSLRTLLAQVSLLESETESPARGRGERPVPRRP